MKILLTGAAGYLGHRLALQAAGKGHWVHALVANPLAANLPHHAHIRFFKGDVTQPQAVAEAMAGCEYVIHTTLPDAPAVGDRKGLYRTQVGGTQNVLAEALRAGVKRMVFSTTCFLDQTPNSFALQKAGALPEQWNDAALTPHWASKLVKAYVASGLPVVTVSWPEVNGPGMHPSASPDTRVTCQATNRRCAFIPADTSRVSSYTFIEDVAHGHLLALERGKVGGQYFLGGQHTSYEELFDTLRTISDQDVQLFSVPRILLLTWGAIFSGFARLLGLGAALSPASVRSNASGSTMARVGLNPAIAPLYAGIEKTLQHFKTVSRADR